jgi:hypothetical protein
VFDRQNRPPISLSAALISASISAISARDRCDNRAATRDGTASIAVRTVRRMPAANEDVEQTAPNVARATPEPQQIA